MHRFDDASTPEPHASTATAVFDRGEFSVVVLDERTRQVHRLNSSAAAVWLLCDGAVTASELSTELASLLELSESDATRGVRDSLDSLWTQGLLAGSPPPTALADRADHPDDQRVLDRMPDP